MHDHAVEVIHRLMRSHTEIVHDHTLREALEHAIDRPGKFVRARLCMMSAALFNTSYEAVIQQAMSLELFHLFSLVHDDIMDEAAVRRGAPSVYQAYGRDMAILVGDVLYALSLECLVKGLPSACVGRAVTRFAQIGRMVCDGQAMDMSFEQGAWATIEDYTRMIEGKTAALMGWAMELGALAANADSLKQQQCYAIGVDQGVVFQIQDDILDVYGSSTHVGKVHAGDIRQGKQSILTVLCRASMEEKRRREDFERLYRSTDVDKDEKVARVMEFYEIQGVRDQAVRMQQDRMMQQSVADLAGDIAASEELMSFFQSLKDRIS